MRFLRAVQCAGLAGLLAGSLVAQDFAEPAGSANLTYSSLRVFRGIERAGPSAQLSGEFTAGDFRAGVWGNQPFSSGSGKEVDLDAGYSWRAKNGWAVEISAAGYWFFGVPAEGTKRSWESGLTVSLPAVQGFTASVAYFRDFRSDTDTVQLALTRSVPLTQWGAFLDFKLLAGCSVGDNWRPDAPGPKRRDGYDYWGAEVNLPFRVGARTVLITGLHFSDTTGRSAVSGPDGRSAAAKLGLTVGVNLDF